MSIKLAVDLLDLSDERDRWLRLALDWAGSEYRRGYQHGHDHGFADGRAEACVAIAEIEDQRESAERWDEWARRLRAADVAAIRARHPRTWSQLERLAVAGVRLAPEDGGQHG